ncbi:trifunctional transcriptional regulator/proline dehydrogenase/L-glutamate gamma-semialdehyde dehydrogenase [Diaphorobacter caeni]|uniref:trifunctional transcriptional regulator/proline dehydrogenase/L-glutamate gamma-semialdehyde dehydrogenase n=1 Tax=Diaphorobacter caeni TaxID=2784387 RepID=UPI00188FA2B7|nr:trifunctional transcriptional regulator/proline dehydrogenase/L-glutamate gamma-semialdehyde dehydrogenase [Diaphorobacter caeni]MBF5005701.1 trifunctional transcriptional regulator/proline dehydrogenase/L-glutamate gamma-semialdehyde dehydrogenase [Diaphorobacter caeni]
MNTASAAAHPAFAPRAQQDNALRQAITAACRIAEPEAIAPLLAMARVPADRQGAVHDLALQLARNLRERKSDQGRAGIVQGLLQEFALSSQEGVALMCLAEALLRIPDAATRDALIRDKISNGDWDRHLGKSPSLFVNAATWGLLITGKLVATHSEGGLKDALRRITARGGEPLIRKGVDMAMRMMGEQFVTGETIAEALKHAAPLEAEGFRYSYDMLGEAALTADDAERYMQSYVDAINAIGKASNGRGVYEGPGISIKLSALHPRYSRAQHQRVMDELYPRVLKLANLARQHDIGLNIDAEEADRLEISLDLLERLCHEPSLKGFKGIGFVIQAYQKRCPFVIDFVIDLARRTHHRLMVRLVKGAYWDSEIKRAQVDGLADYPVYTRKSHTDVSYIACARKLLAAPDAIYPQFATHNAQTLATLYTLADPATYAPGQYEFQCLHGMGEPLYEQVVGSQKGKLGRPCRVYAPVGTHETLLAYLVRRLLENGANTSFVNRVADNNLPLESLIENPVDTVDADTKKEGRVALPHPRIPLPPALYGGERVNSAGLDLASESTLSDIDAALRASAAQPQRAEPLIAGHRSQGTVADVTNPADRRELVGQVQEATEADVDAALTAAQAAQSTWAATAPAERAALLCTTADLLEAELLPLVALTMREAGKTAANAVAEVREAVDFLRYYAAQAELLQSDAASYAPLGPVTCISPWNFPLAIFMGQVSAALAAGNTVLAKPAEQTPLIAAQAVRLLHRAGVPEAVMQLLPGRGETVGAALVGDARVMGVMFTGSTEVARILQRNLARRFDAHGQPIPLIAETGGQNALIVDSSALVEQVVVDVVSSAFDSAGQRCSALRVLCVQSDVAERVSTMLRGAMQELHVGDTTRLAVDMGPVIDEEARATIEAHIDAMRAKGHAIFQPPVPMDEIANGSFVKPTLITLNSIADLGREVFGPVLHLVRYERENLDQLLDQINGTGYGLTQGLHTRIDETVNKVIERAQAGNLYVNRNIVGAVVGVQPFGGEGLSGTGPKAGGPLYMLRLMTRHPASAARTALARTAAKVPDLSAQRALQAPLQALSDWAAQNQRERVRTACAAHAESACAGMLCTLPSPTGERNEYRVLPREQVLCIAGDDDALLVQLSAVLAVGSRALWPSSAQALHAQLPAAVQQRVVLANDWSRDSVHFDAVLHAGDEASLQQLCEQIAQRPGAIISVTHVSGDDRVALERLVLERALSVNTAAAGGNASLMTLA